MTIRTKAAAVLGYRTIPTTIITVLSYLAILLALRITDKLENVPKPQKQRGLNISEAYHDLQMITAQPHPYNSHSNDAVRDYILGKVLFIADAFPGVEVIADDTSNVTFATSAQTGIYFEGTNVLVKIQGKGDFHANDIDSGAVLFSAHYDSVSTAPGVTDDGMGVVTLLQLIRYFAEHRQRRTAVFNINNGEEDGLHGAHAFLEHPWAKLCDSFLNLEGAAAGGRPILFRATSAAPVRALRKIAHPHSNVLSADAFSRGVIRSGTDYSVYTGLDAHPRGTFPSLLKNGQQPLRESVMSDPRGGMAGLDLAFYKGRSRYHTKYDSSQYTLGGQRSLWAMMDAARGIGEALLSVPLDKGPGPNGKRIADGDQGVWFDLFKWHIVVFKLKTLLTWNIVLLVVGPILLALLVFTERFFLHQRHEHHHHTAHQDNNSGRPAVAGARSPPPIVPGSAAAPPESAVHGQESHPHLRYFSRLSTSSVPQVGAANNNNNGTAPPVHVNHDIAAGNGHDHGHDGGQRHWALMYTDVIWNHAKFWFALAVVAGFLSGLTAAFVAINPFSIYSSPYVILFSFISLAYLALVYTITFPAWLPFYRSKYALAPAGSMNPMQEHKQATFLHLYIFTWIMLVAGTVGITRLDPGVAGGYLFTIWNGLLLVACALCVLEGLTTRQDSTDGHAHASGSDDGEIPRRSHRHVEDADSDERTPLMWHGAHEGRTAAKEDDSHETLGTWWWLPQFLVSVPIPVILWAQVVMLLLDSMPQSLADGGKPLGVYVVTAVSATFLVLPLAPFADKLRPFHPLSMVIAIIFVLTTLYAWLRFPFDINIPLKVYFQQRIELPANRVAGSNLVDAAGLTIVNGSVALAPIVKTTLSGPDMYIRDLIPYLPSAHGQTPSCRFESLRSGLLTCEWDSTALMPSPGQVAPPPGSPPPRKPRPRSDLALPTEWAKDELLKASVERTSQTTAQITVKGQNTRNCRVYFETHSIDDFDIWAEADEDLDDASSHPTNSRGTERVALSGKMQEGYEIGPNGLKELRLWSRNWDREFGVNVDWRSFVNRTSPDAKFRGRISCNWNEYESALVGNLPHVGTSGAKSPSVASATKDGRHAKVPAYEEALTFMPDWVTLTKYTDGLVEAWVPFAL